MFVHGKNLFGAADRGRLLPRRRRLHDDKNHAVVGLYADDDRQSGFTGTAGAVRSNSAGGTNCLFLTFHLLPFLFPDPSGGTGADGFCAEGLIVCLIRLIGPTRRIGPIGLLGLRDNDKSFYISFLTKNILNILFTLSNSEDIIHKENLIKLLLYYTKYLKNLYNSSLIEGIFEILINMLFSYDCYGIVVIDILKILCELLDTKIINNIFCKNGMYIQKFNENSHLLVIICINIIKEEGVNSTKSEIALNTLYQIIKKHRINIYNDYTKDTILKSYNDNKESSNKYNNIRISNINRNKSLNKEEINNNKKTNQKQNKKLKKNFKNKNLKKLKN